MAPASTIPEGGLCRQCGYDLSGLPPAEVADDNEMVSCPECGGTVPRFPRGIPRRKWPVLVVLVAPVVLATLATHAAQSTHLRLRGGLWFSLAIAAWLTIPIGGLTAPYLHAGCPWKRTHHVTRVALGLMATLLMVWVTLALCLVR